MTARVCLIAATALVTLLLTACGTPPGAPEAVAPASAPAGDPAADWLLPRGQALALDSEASRIEIRVYRAGRLAHLGHNHVIEVLGLDGRLKRVDEGSGVAELRFRPDRLRVDGEAARLRAGEDFAQMPDAKAVSGTRANMLGEQVLDAGRWPEVRILARVASLSPGEVPADVQIYVRDVGRRYAVPLTVQADGDRVRVSGSLRLRQSDFGISPFSVLGGALQVRDEIDAVFQIVGRNSGRAM